MPNLEGMQNAQDALEVFSEQLRGWIRDRRRYDDGTADTRGLGRSHWDDPIRAHAEAIIAITKLP